MTTAHFHQRAIAEITQILGVSTLEDPTQAAARQTLERSAQALVELMQTTATPQLSVVFADAMIFLNGQNLDAERGAYERALEQGRQLQQLGVNEVCLEAGLRAGDLRSLVEQLVWLRRRGAQQEAESRPSPRVVLRRTDASLLVGLEDERLEPSEQATRACASALIVMERLHEGMLKGDLGLLHHVHRVARSLATLSSPRHAPWLLGFVATAPNRGDAPTLAVKGAILATLTMRHITDAHRVLVDVALTALLYDVGALRAMRVWNHARRHGFEVVPRMNEDAADRLPEATASALLLQGQLHEAALARSTYAMEAHMLGRRDTRGMPHEGRMAPTLEAVTLATVRRYLSLVSTTAHAPRPLTPDEALDILLEESGSKLERFMVQLFLHLIGLHHPGTPVVLASGARGVLLKNAARHGAFHMPRVLVVYDEHGRALHPAREVDLSQGTPEAVALGCVTALDEQPDETIRALADRITQQHTAPAERPPAISVVQPRNAPSVEELPELSEVDIVPLDTDDAIPEVFVEVEALDASVEVEVLSLHDDDMLDEEPSDAEDEPGADDGAALARITPVRKSAGSGIQERQREFGEDSRFGGIIRSSGEMDAQRRDRPRRTRRPIGPQDVVGRSSAELDASPPAPAPAAPEPPATPGLIAAPVGVIPAPRAAFTITADDLMQADDAPSLGGVQVVSMDAIEHLMPATFSRFGFEEDEAARAAAAPAAPVARAPHLAGGTLPHADEAPSRSDTSRSEITGPSSVGRVQIRTMLDDTGASGQVQKVSVADILQEVSRYADDASRAQIEDTLDDNNAISREELFRMLGMQAGQVVSKPRAASAPESAPESTPASDDALDAIERAASTLDVLSDIDVTPPEIDAAAFNAINDAASFLEEPPLAPPPRSQRQDDATSEYNVGMFRALAEASMAHDDEDEGTAEVDSPVIASLQARERAIASAKPKPQPQQSDPTSEINLSTFSALIAQAQARRAPEDDEGTAEVDAAIVASLRQASRQPDEGNDHTSEYSREQLLGLARASAPPAPAAPPDDAGDDATGEYALGMLADLHRQSGAPTTTQVHDPEEDATVETPDALPDLALEDDDDEDDAATTVYKPGGSFIAPMLDEDSEEDDAQPLAPSIATPHAEEDDAQPTAIVSDDELAAALAPDLGPGYDPFSAGENGATIVLSPDIIRSYADEDSLVEQDPAPTHATPAHLASAPPAHLDDEDSEEDDDAPPTAILSGDVLDYLKELDRRD